MMERPVNGSIQRIDRSEYEPFAERQHLFLIGNLQRENPHPFVRDPRLELILCYYNSGDDGLPHWHREVTEYEIVIEGESGILEVATGRARWFGSGDLVVIPPGVCVKRLVRKTVRTLAIKIPSKAEKVHCAGCPRECSARLAPYFQEEPCASR
jgi:mannose-6-phosphate isomerase-like protein (cupin superfamily)